MSSENHQIRQDRLVLLLSNHDCHRLFPFHQVGGNGGGGELKILKKVSMLFQHKKEIVPLSKMIRVGGRSKEPELASCNLNNFTRARDELVSSSQ